MLRVLLWKTGAEWANLKRLLSPRDQRRIYYFAFGANLSAAVLAERRIRVFEAVDYRLDGASLRFSQPGFYRGHGYASADPGADDAVYGRMYLILERDAERMDYYEGVPFLRAHDKVYGEFRGRPFYFYRTTRVVDGLRPTREYLDYIVDACREMPQVPGEYLERLARTPVLEARLPQDLATLLISDLERWPRWSRPLLLRYERFGLALVEWLWHRSPIQGWIRP